MTEARLVEELARTPGRAVAWYILADAIGDETTEAGKHRVQATVSRVREKFGAESVRTDVGRGYLVAQGFPR